MPELGRELQRAVKRKGGPSPQARSRGGCWRAKDAGNGKRLGRCADGQNQQTAWHIQEVSLAFSFFFVLAIKGNSGTTSRTRWNAEDDGLALWKCPESAGLAGSAVCFAQRNHLQIS